MSRSTKTIAKTSDAKCLTLTTSFSREHLTGADFFALNLAGAGKEVLHWNCTKEA